MKKIGYIFWSLAVLWAVPLMAQQHNQYSANVSVVSQHEQIEYPQARRDNVVDDYFGTEVPAPYRWMENLNSPDVKAWVQAENKVTFSYLNKIPVRNWIRERLTKLWNYAKVGVPDRKGNYLYFSKNSGLQNQSVVYKQNAMNEKTTEILDPNKLSKGGSIALAGYQISPNGEYMAYALSQGGSDWRVIHVMNISTGKELPNTVKWVKFSGISWTKDSKGFFYSRYPEPPAGQMISHEVKDQKLYYHKLGTPQSKDKLIYSRPDLPDWIIGGFVSDNGRFLFVELINGTATQNELFYADLGNAKNPEIKAAIKPLYTKNDAEYQPIGTKGNTVYLETTLDAPKRKIVAVDLTKPSVSNWQTVVPEGKGVIQNALLADGRIVVESMVVAKSRIEIYSTDGKQKETLPLPGIGTVSGLSGHYDSPDLYYDFTSFLYPRTVFHYNISTRKNEVFFKPKVDFNPSEYVTHQVFYRSKDGTEVPMFITARRDVKLDGSNPTILYGYGGFDITITPSFNPMLPVWLKMGGIYAVANLRGGGVYGEAWHKAGMLGNKQNVFNDFISAAEYLIREKYTSPARLGIQGYSNGGLLIGATITQRPDLFGAAYAGAGVMDMLRYQKFSGGNLWAPEYGTSANPKAFKWLYAYSPLQNLKQGVCYPPTIITTADHDDRVVPSHSYKFTATMQHDQGCRNPVLIRVETETSHGYMPTDKRIAQTADVWAFMAYNLGITNPPAMNTTN